MLRKWLKYAVVFVIVLFMAFGIMLASGGLTKLVQWSLEVVLRSNNIPAQKFSVSKATANELEVFSLSFGGGTLTIDRIHLSFDLEQLLHGFIDEISITGLTVHAEFREGKLKIPILDQLSLAGDKADFDTGFSIPDLPFKALSLDGQAIVNLPGQTVHLPFTAYTSGMSLGLGVTSTTLGFDVQSISALKDDKTASVHATVTLDNFTGIEGIASVSDIDRIDSLNGSLDVFALLSLDNPLQSSIIINPRVVIDGPLAAKLYGQISITSQGNEAELAIVPELSFEISGPVPQVIVDQGFDAGGVVVNGMVNAAAKLSIPFDQITSLDVSQANVTISPLIYQGLSLQIPLLSISATSDAEQLKGHFELSVSVDGQRLEIGSIDGSNIQLAGDIKLNDSPLNLQQISLDKLLRFMEFSVDGLVNIDLPQQKLSLPFNAQTSKVGLMFAVASRQLGLDATANVDLRDTDVVNFGANVIFDDFSGIKGIALIPLGAKVKGSVALNGTLPMTSDAHHNASITVTNANGSISPAHYAGMIVSIPQISFSGKGDIEEVKGHLKTTLHIDGVFKELGEISMGKLDLEGGLVIANNDLLFTTLDCQILNFERAVIDNIFELGHHKFCLRGSDRNPLISLQDGVLSVVGNILSTPIDVRMATQGEPLVLSGNSPELSVSILNSPDLQATTATIKSDGGNVVLSDHAISIKLGAFEGLLKQTGDVRDAEGSFAVEEIASLEKVPLFAPFNATGDIKLNGQDLDFTLRLMDQTKTIVVTALGTHGLSSGQGKATYDIPATFFDPLGLQPQKLFPQLQGVISVVTGTASAKGWVAWPYEPLQGTMSVHLDNLSVTTGFARLEGLDLSLTLDELWPPSASAGQVLTLSEADVGVLLKNMYALFDLGKGGVINTEIIQWPWIGGTITSHNAIFDLNSGISEVTVDVEEIELGELFAILEHDDLFGEGLLSGRIPVTLKTEGNSLIAGAELVSVGPGIIRYKNVSGLQTLAAGGAGTTLLSQALEDFHYTDMRIKVNGELAGDLVLNVRLAGYNPKLYGGYPIELNLILQGAVNQLLKSGGTINAIPKMLR